MADISRSEVATLIEEAYSQTLLDMATETSTVLQAFQTVNMGTKTTHLPVLAALPEAGWVSESATDSAGVKPTSEVVWEDRTLVAEEIAVIIPVHENVVDDATVPILENTARLGGQAIGKKLDQAILFGTSKPSSWNSPALLPAAVAAGQTVAEVSGVANESDLPGAVNKVSELIATAGFMPSTAVASLALKFQVANIRDANGQPIFREESFAGYDTFFNRNGAWLPNSARVIIADPTRIIVGIRQDVTVKILTEATVNGINLAERDMIGIRMKARYAYVLGNSATPAGANKYPVGAVTPDVTS